jgi:cell division protein FtsB
VRKLLQRLIRNAKERLLQSRHRLATWGVGTLAALLAYHVLFGANGLVVYQQKQSESTQLQVQVEGLKRQNDALSQRIRSLKSDPQTIEREAREQLRYVRPGEMIYTLPAKSLPASQAEKR